jgi:predicted NodU family carbamoyl transferase
MPMAPVMTEKFLTENYLEGQWSRVIGSEQYMIITYHLDEMGDNDCVDISGVVHKDPLTDKIMTSRPQVTHDEFMLDILKQQPQEALINTSFNYHGEPIILTANNALSTFNRQCEVANEAGLDLPYLFILTS